MSKKALKTIGLVTGGVLAVSMGPAAQALAVEPAEPQGVDKMVADMVGISVADTVKVCDIHGIFSFDQGVSADNATLSKMLYRASDYLCGSQLNEVAEVAATEATASESVSDITAIKISGDIDDSFSANIEEYTEKYPFKKTMTCTCIGNPANGASTANAEVKGFMLAGLIEQAAPSEEVNTITFISKDGYTVGFPLSYVTQRYSVIVTTINGEDTGEAVGCSNQLWLGSTSARYFAQDIVEIKLTHEQEVPEIPQAPDTANQPNVGVLKGS